MFPFVSGAPNPQKHAKACENSTIYCTGTTWRSKWPLGPARVLLERSEGLLGPAWAPPVRSKWPLGPALVPPVRSKRLIEPASALPVRSKWPFWPALVKKCAQKTHSSPLQCTDCAQRGCSSLLFEITIRKCWSRLPCALSHCTLLHFALCMDMHGFTLVYIYIYIYLEG